MTLNVNLEVVPITLNIAQITLSGELNTQTASVFQQQLDEAIGQKPRRLVLLMQDLKYMSSAGIRTLIYANNKLGSGVEIYLVGVQDLVKETLEQAGIDESNMGFLAEYDAAVIEHF